MVRGRLAALLERWTWNPDSCWELLVRTWLLPITNQICDRNWTVAWLHTCILMHSPGGYSPEFSRGGSAPRSNLLSFYRNSSINSPLSNKPLPSNKPPSSLLSSRFLSSLNYSSLINDRLVQFTIFNKTPDQFDLRHTNIIYICLRTLYVGLTSSSNLGKAILITPQYCLILCGEHLTPGHWYCFFL